MRKCLLAIFAALVTACASTSSDFQRDADIVRLNHLEYYGNLIQAYHEKAGYYPFEEHYPVPTYVHVANDRQVQYTRPGPPYKHQVIPFKEFVTEVESVLSEPINEYYDPQYAPVYKPNFYIYMVNQDTYYFAIHVHQPYPFATKIADHYYKVELSNHPNSQNMAKDPQVLFGSREFIAAKNSTISKPGFFREREDKYLHYTKTAE